jgi:hypothetical protein
VAPTRTVADIVRHYLSEKHRQSRTLKDIAAALQERAGKGSDTALSAWAHGQRVPDSELVRKLRGVVRCACPEFGDEAISEAFHSYATALSHGRPSESAVRGHAKLNRERSLVDRLCAHLGRQGRLPRLGERGAGALTLRVHESIPLDEQQRPSRFPRRSSRTRNAGDGLDLDLPTFVDRDVGPQVREWMRSASVVGGFLILVGDSSVGKTRLLYESAREVLPDFFVLAPDLGEGDLVNAVAEAPFPLPKLIVWLDELQRFLPGPYFVGDGRVEQASITAAAVRKLLAAESPVIIVGTLWPEYAAQLRTSDQDPVSGADRLRYPHAMDVLSVGVRDMALLGFSDTERDMATALATTDSRLATAVGDRDYNVTEVLAGARQIVRRYEQATEAQRAILHAAVDARRVGVQSVLTEELLRTAARGYLTSVHPDDLWFSAAMAELTSSRRPHDVATAPLISIPNADRTAVLGYEPADYLLQRLVRQRRQERIPEATWQALASHVNNHGDLSRLAESAYRRMLYRIAEPLYRRLDKTRGNVDIWFFTDLLTLLLSRQRRTTELHARAAAGNSYAATLYTEHLVEHGRLDELRSRAHACDKHAARRLPYVLAQHGHLDEATSLLQVRIDAGDPDAMYQLAYILAEHNQVDEAIALLRATPDIPGDDEDTVATRLAELLASQHRLDDLRTVADSGSWPAAYRLADLLATQGLVDELRDRAKAGDLSATHRYAELLVTDGSVAEALAFLRDQADAANQAAIVPYAKLLAAQGQTDQAIAYLRPRANSSTRTLLADLLAEQGQFDQALAVLPARPSTNTNDPFDDPWPIDLTEFQARHGLLDELRADADAGVDYAAELLAQTLAEQDNLKDLRHEVDTGNRYAGAELVSVLRRHGRVQEAECIYRFGLNPDGTVAMAAPQTEQQPTSMLAEH